MTSVKNLPAILSKIVEGTAPERFNRDHLKSLGFKSSNDFSVIPLLKDLGFLAGDGSPTPRYHAYRDRSRSRQVLGTAVKEAYEDLFHVNEQPSESDRSALEGKFKSVHNATDRVAAEQVRTFLALLKEADLSVEDNPPQPTAPPEPQDERPSPPQGSAVEESRHVSSSAGHVIPGFTGLRYNIEIHLPATKDLEVYNAIFKSLKEHLIDD